MYVLIATEKPFSTAAVKSIKEVLESEGHQVEVLEKYNQQELTAALGKAEALIVRSDIIGADQIGAAPNLKIIVRAGAGYDNIDLEACRKAGIVVENTPGQNSRAVAEMVIGMAISAARNNFDGTTGGEISGRKLGLQAFGQVSRNVAQIASGFGMEVMALDPFCKAEVIEAQGVKPVNDIKELYSGSQILSIHIPATEQTRGSIGYELVSLMPKGGILINTARKEVIDEEGLIRALTERPDLKYYADVRPAQADRMIELFGNRVFFTPKKCGAQTAEANLKAGVAAAHQINSFFKTGKPTFKVN